MITMMFYRYLYSIFFLNIFENKSDYAATALADYTHDMILLPLPLNTGADNGVRKI